MALEFESVDGVVVFQDSAVKSAAALLSLPSFAVPKATSDLLLCALLRLLQFNFSN